LRGAVAATNPLSDALALVMLVLRAWLPSNHDRFSGADSYRYSATFSVPEQKSKVTIPPLLESSLYLGTSTGDEREGLFDAIINANTAKQNSHCANKVAQNINKQRLLEKC